jgi:hypothetical protein
MVRVRKGCLYPTVQFVVANDRWCFVRFPVVVYTARNLKAQRRNFSQSNHDFCSFSLTLAISTSTCPRHGEVMKIKSSQANGALRTERRDVLISSYTSPYSACSPFAWGGGGGGEVLELSMLDSPGLTCSNVRAHIRV